MLRGCKSSDELGIYSALSSVEELLSSIVA
jgi:hypothetical protein